MSDDFTSSLASAIGEGEAEEPTEDPFGSFSDDDMDVDFEFDAAIARVPDGPMLLQVQSVFFNKEYKPEKGVTTVGTFVQLKVASDGPYKGNFLNKFIWWGNDVPSPQGVRQWIAFAEAALGEKQEGQISPKRYSPAWREVPNRGRQIALEDFDDCLVVGILSTRKGKDGQERQEVVGWKPADSWVEGGSSNEFREDPF